MEWLVPHRLVAHPRAFAFEVDTLLHPRAYWVTVETLAQPGRIGVVRARAESNQLARLELEQVSAVSVWPDPEVFDVTRPLQVLVLDATVFSGVVSPNQEVILTRAGAELASAAASVIARLEMRGNAFPTVLAGGIFRGIPWLVDDITNRLSEIAPRSWVRPLDVEPAIGAVRLAIAAVHGSFAHPTYL